MPSSGAASGSIRLGWFARISFGRPVEPPDVIALYGFETASGNGPASKPSTSSGASTTTREPASSMIASSSRFGQARRDRLRNRAQLPARDRRRDERDAVRQRDRHEVVLADALRRQGARGAVRERLRARPASPRCRALVGVDGERGMFGVRPRRAAASRCGYEIRATTEILARHRSAGQPTSANAAGRAAPARSDRRRDGRRSPASS